MEVPVCNTFEDTCCTLIVYFQVQVGKFQQFKEKARRAVELTKKQPQCLYFGFCFNEARQLAFCRQGYESAEGVMTHLEHIDHSMLRISELLRLEVHGPETELAKLKEPLSQYSPEYFTLAFGFRRNQIVDG